MLHTQRPLVDLTQIVVVLLDKSQVSLGALAQAVRTNDVPGIVGSISINTVTVLALAVCSVDQVVTQSGGTTDEPHIGAVTISTIGLTRDQATVTLVLTEDGKLVEAKTTTDLPGVILGYVIAVAGNPVSEDQETAAFPMTADTPGAIPIRIIVGFILDGE